MNWRRVEGIESRTCEATAQSGSQPAGPCRTVDVCLSARTRLFVPQVSQFFVHNLWDGFEPFIVALITDRLASFHKALVKFPIFRAARSGPAPVCNQVLLVSPQSCVFLTSLKSLLQLRPGPVL